MSFDPFQGPYTGNSFGGVSPGFGISGQGTGQLYGFGSGQASRPGGPAGSNTLGYNIMDTVARDPVSRYLHTHTSGWLQDPGAAILHILGGPGAATPAAPPPQMRALQSTPGAANPAGNLSAQLRAQALRKPTSAQQLKSGQTVNFGSGPSYAGGPSDQVPYPVA